MSAVPLLPRRIRGREAKNGRRGQSLCPAGELQLESRTAAVSKEIVSGLF